MVMKKTILSSKELAILEKVISSLGYIAHIEDINDLLAEDYSIQQIRRRISLLSRRGWLIRIKRGVYAVANLESHSFANISPLLVSQVLLPNSYVSYEFALYEHGLFDQLPAKLTAITPGKPKKFTFQGTEYEYKKIKPVLYLGFAERTVDGHAVNIAELEKAFLDYLYYRIDTYSVDLVLEKLKEGKDDLDIDRLYDYARRYPVSVIRRLGFLLDLIEVPTDELREDIKSRRDFSKLTNISDIFNARWRIYYEDRFTE
jgi:predicted transcriptional regulator of viral defense system